MCTVVVEVSLVTAAIQCGCHQIQIDAPRKVANWCSSGTVAWDVPNQRSHKNHGGNSLLFKFRDKPVPPLHAWSSVRDRHWDPSITLYHRPSSTAYYEGKPTPKVNSKIHWHTENHVRVSMELDRVCL